MNEYQFFGVDELIRDDAFRRWVYQPMPSDSAFWDEWLVAHPDKAEVVQQARRQLLAIRGELPALSDEYINSKVGQLLERVRQAEAPEPVVRSLRPVWYAVAASVALLLGVFGWWQFRQPRVGSPVPATYAQLLKTAPLPLTETVNGGPNARRITLPDGSIVTLYANSRLSYPNVFADSQRAVYLTGLAFFEVQKNPDRPFLVYANELVTKVLGTSFFVRAYEQDRRVQVTVRTGRVSVFARTAPDAPAQLASRTLRGMLLTPNQEATLTRQDQRLSRSLVAEPQRVDEPANQTLTASFVFKQTPVADVLRTLERAYGINIVFDEDRLARCTLTARLDDESLYKKLDWICAATESSYERVDGQIILTSRGCP